MHAPRPSSLLAGPYTGPTRRLQPRNSLRWPVTIEIAQGAERRGTTVDLSPQGLSLSTDRPIAPGSRCLLRLSPPGSGAEPLVVQVKSVYSSYVAPGDFRIGMVFLAEDARGRDRLRAWAAEQA